MAIRSVGPDLTPSLVILPGLMCDSRMFGATLGALAGSAVIDGFYGEADRIEAMADHALARMPERCALLGHSMGARVALEVFRKAPGRVERLALVDTGVHPVAAGEREKRHRLRDLGRQKGMAALAKNWLPPMLASRALADGALVGRLFDMAVSAGLATFEAQIEALLNRPATGELLGTISCPVSVIVGAEDRWVPVVQHQAIAAAIPNAALHVVEGAGHMLPAEAPAAFNAILEEWLAAPSAR